MATDKQQTSAEQDHAKRAAQASNGLSATEERSRIIMRTGTVGIVANVLLSAFKALVGVLSNSIAIILDAVNNLSDALSSILTIAGTKVANREPDREHPFGHGRAEYITTIIIAVIILWAGITALQESIQRIVSPQAASYDALTLGVVAVATVVKIVLGRYTTARGKAANSDTLIASGKDAMLDSVISASTLVAAIIFLVWGISLEAWLGAIIAFVILKAGIDILREAMSKILGRRVSPEVSTAVKRTVCSFPEVHGAYDLAVSDFGPDRLRGSVNIEVDDEMTAAEVAKLSRRIQMKVLNEHDVILNSIGIYSTNTADPIADAMRQTVTRIVFSHPHVLELHGFYVNKDTRELNFDVIISYDAKDRKAIYREICEEVQSAYPDWHLMVILDADVSD
ncbi:MAG: cation diffusion facilitator family transporter [Eggerthellaceae bacterium]|jgi:cation diffusion facilitator family transporter